MSVYSKLFAFVALVAVTACVRSAEVTCDDGRICPPGNTCDNVNHLCVSPDQTAACTGLGEGDACEFSGVPGLCHAGACDPLLCGDGVRTGTEACDGNDLGGADCTTAGFYAPDGLACTPFCTFDTSQCVGRCGDGMIDGPELCDGAPPSGTCIDNGFDAGPLGCSGSCGASFADCGRFGWRPEATGSTTGYAIAGRSATDLWVFDTVGTAHHYDGVNWTAHATIATDGFSDAWETAADDVWAVSAEAVVHWDGTAWTAATGLPAASYSAVWAASSTAAYVGTRTAGVQAWNGSTWAALGSWTGGAVGAVRGTGPSDIWAAGATALWHWDGTSWQSALTAEISSIAAVSATDVWVAGTIGPTFSSLVANWNGAAWTETTNPVTGLYSNITASAPNDAWVTSGASGLQHFDGHGWSPMTKVGPSGVAPPGVLLELASNDAVGVSPDGALYRYHGQAYAEFDTGVVLAPAAYWMSASNDQFVADSAGRIEHFDGTSWTGSGTVVGSNLGSLFGTGSDVFAGAQGGEVYSFDRLTSTWSLLTTGGNQLAKLWGTGPSDLWLFTDSGAQRFDGAGLTSYATVTGVTSVSGTGTDDIWAVSSGTLVHWAGASWDIDPTCPSTSLIAVVAISPTDVVAVDASFGYAWDGTSWTTSQLPFVSTVKTLAASSAHDVIAASATELAQFDGSRWAPIHLPDDVEMPPNASIAGISVVPSMLGIAFAAIAHSIQLRGLARTTPWVCETTETDCSDGVDNDCDGKVDNCP